jgi:hypothetical protein
MKNSDGKSETPSREHLTDVTPVLEYGTDPAIPSSQKEPPEIEINHLNLKFLHISNPVPSLAYIHIIVADGRHFNLYLNKGHMKLLHHQSQLALGNMVE